MSSWLGKFHDFTGKYDPLGHALVDGAWKSSTKLVNETSRGLENWGDKWGINTKIPEYGKNLSQKDKDSFSRWGENTLGSIGALYAGGAALGGEAGAAGGAGAGAAEAGGAGAAGAGGGGAASGGGLFGLGEAGAGYGGAGLAGEAGVAGEVGAGGAGAASGMPIGAGGYAEQGGGYVADAPGGGFNWINGDGTSGATGDLGQGSAGMNWQKMIQQGMSGMQKGQQQGGGRSGRQNLPIFENEKSDQQKLAELLTALQEQQGPYG